MDTAPDLPPADAPARRTPGPALAAELAGSFGFVFAGCLAAGAHYADAELGVLGIALAAGLVLAGLTAALAPVSGAHLNPAATLAMVLLRRMEVRAGGRYLAAQAVGAALGATAAGWALPSLVAAGAGYGLPRIAFDVAPAQAFLAELTTAAVLVLVWLGASVDARGPRASAGLLVGLAFAGLAAAALPLSGGAINPLRWLGPAIRAADPATLWPHLIAPLLGGAAAAALFRFLCPERFRTGGVPESPAAD